GQPHARRGGGAWQAAAGARLGGHRPAVRPGARALLHLVELSFSGLDEERPRPAARPYVVLAGAGRPGLGARGAGAVPELGAAVRSCAADLRDRSLTDRSAVRIAIAMLRSGRPVRIEGKETLTVAAVETITPELLKLRDPEHCARLMLSGQRAAA